MANQGDGTATARLITLDDGELEIPLVITQQASNVTLAATILAGVFAGVLNREGTELAGVDSGAAGRARDVPARRGDSGQARLTKAIS